MLTKSTARLILLVLITSFVGLSDLAGAQSRDSNLPDIPRLETYETESNKNEILRRLKDQRSVVLRKESARKEYAKVTAFLNAGHQRKEEVESELETINSSYGRESILPSGVVDRLSLLQREHAKLLNWVEAGASLADLWVEEYDVLSRLEEVERRYKAKVISKLDYISEERRLVQELSQLRMARQLEDLGLRLADGLHRIESELNLLRYAR